MKVLIVKTSALGDIIHAYPTLSYIKQLYPEATVDWVVEDPFKELVQSHPQIDRTLIIKTKEWRSALFSIGTRREVSDFLNQLRQRRYDVLFDLQGNTKSALVTVASRADVKVGFSRNSVAEWPNLIVTNHKYSPPPGRNIREDYLYLARSYFNDDAKDGFTDASVKLAIEASEQKLIDSYLDLGRLQHKRLILVCPGSAWQNKQMRHEDFQVLMQRITEEQPNSFFLLVWGNNSEKDYCFSLMKKMQANTCLVERLSLPALQRLMWEVDHVIAMDSLPLHLTGTTPTPTWSVFGPSSAKKYAPIGEHHQYYQGTCPYGKTFEKRCPVLRSCPTGACIREVDIEKILHSLTHSH